ncbi:MAG: hypothetical protein N2Z74_06020, partial [Syntrophales bacterium]|nr:hypothetical protein [Syntrophales bacterium]
MCIRDSLLILLFLLKKFLFGRIIAAIDAREAKIAARFAEAEEAKREAEEAATTCQLRLQDIEGRFEEMLAKARRDAEAYREQLLEKAREEVDFLKARWIEALQSERETFLQELRQLAGSQIYAITRRVLKDLAGLDLEERIAQVLMERLAALDEQQRQRFLAPEAAEEEEERQIVVSCAYDMPPEMQRRLYEIIKRYLPSEVEVIYEQSPDVLSGCELRSDGHKLAWSMKEYLDSLEERFYSALYEQARERR